MTPSGEPPADGSMPLERWRAIKSTMAEALELDPAQRAEFLDQACGIDAALRREVESLLAASDAADEAFLARPAIHALGVSPAAGMEDDAFAGRLAAALGERYQITRELGGGGMSRVFLATERALDRQVVIKILSQELAAGVSIDRFKREIAFVARLQHANIVPLLNAGEVNGLPYYTMPFVEGLSLRSRLQSEGAMDVGEAVAVLHDLARALAYAHDHGVVHRDVKPDNVLLAGGAAVVTDFGIAKALTTARGGARPKRDHGASDADPRTLTEIGTTLGTPAYIPPEQAAGGELDHRSDVYALGCTAYELFSGRPPFHGRPVHGLILAHISEQPKPVIAARGRLPTALADLVMRCLAKEPAGRPSAADIVHALDPGRSLAESPGANAEVVATERRASRRRPRLAFAGAAIVVAAALLAGRAWQRFVRVGDEPRTVAVLPFVNVGGDTTNTYFTAGLADELTNALAKVEGLVVTPPRAANGALPSWSPDVARKLGVATLLAGSVQRSGERLRVRVQLLSGTDGHVLWSNAYDKTLADVFAVQTSIADSVAASLRLTLSRTDHARVAGASGTRNAEAYLLYLQGRYAAAQYTEPDLRRAITLYGEAIERDSTFARAWAGMADAWASLAGDFVSPNEALRAAGDGARRALALDSTLAEGHIALGNVLLSEWDAVGAATAFGRAVSLERNSAATHYYLASALLPLGRFDEALAHAATAHNLEPSQPAYATAIALIQLRAGRFDSAAATARRAYALDSTFTYAATVLGDALRLKGAPAQALDAYASRGPAQSAYDLVGPALARIALGQPDEARRILTELTALGARRNVPPDALAMVYAGLGDRDRAFDWLERAYAARSAALVSLGTDQDWAALRRDPRFADLMRRVRR